MSELPPIVVNVEDAPTVEHEIGAHWGAVFKILTPGMRPRGGSLGVNLNRVSEGRATVPFHTHLLEDEVFYILEGRGVLRYGEELQELRAGDCVSCPAGTKVAHQIANPHAEDLVYLAIGRFDPHEVCTYPDTDKVMIRALDRTIGRVERTSYMDGEPERPKIFELLEGRDAS